MSSEPNNLFAINQTNGEIFTSGNLDREKCDSYKLNISATDHGTEPQRSYATVLVNVADINDNTPRIFNMPNRTNVSEAARPGVEVFKVVAVDADAGINAKLSFAIVSGNTYFPTFIVYTYNHTFTNYLATYLICYIRLILVKEYSRRASIKKINRKF